MREMIGKILFFVSIFLLLKIYSFGQVCTPDPQYTNTSTQNGIYPDTLTDFTTAYAGVPYNQLITIVIPPDTTIPPLFPIPWDSTRLDSVYGLPASLSYACWNNNGTGNFNRCMFKGNSIGCAIITGTPASGEIGTHLLKFYTSNYLGGQTAANPYVITTYKIVVMANPAGVNEYPNIQVIKQNNPNPFNDKSEILFTAEDFGTAQFKIYNMIGTVVQEYDIAVKKGINKLALDAKDFDSGIYFYALVSGSNAFTRKMIVKK